MSVKRETPHCDYCGLPLVFLWRPASKASASGAHFCCLGCRIASQVTAERGDAGQARGTLARLGIATFFAMNVMVFTLVIWSRDLYQVADAHDAPRLFGELLRYLSLLFAIPVLFLLGQPLVENAWTAVFEGRPSMDVLVVVGVFAAFAFSVLTIVRGQGDTYFEVVCMVLLFVTFGRWLEATGRVQAGDAITQLEKLLPQTTLRRSAGQFQEVRLEDVRAGDVLMVRSGERCPVDGKIVEGSTSMDEQILTGESSPINKSQGHFVLAGALNLDGTILVEANASATEGTLARLVHLVRQAQELKGPTQRLSDRVAGWLLPLVALIAVLTFFWHWQQSHLEVAWLSAFAVVLVSCPCSLGLATPLAVWTALCQAAKRQVLFTSGDAVEKLAAVRAVRFDKTGTLTTGEPRLHQIITSPHTNADAILSVASDLASHSTHVFSQAIIAFRQNSSDELYGPTRNVRNVRVSPGLGISGTRPDSNARVALGSRCFLEAEGFQFDEALEWASHDFLKNSSPVSYVGWNDQAQGVLIFEESLRPTAKAALEKCREQNLDVVVLTGDRAARGKFLAEKLKAEVVAGLLPQEKVEQIRLAQQRWGRVAMVGDGVNDAAALATADVGVALGCGADITRDTAQVCLLGNDLLKLPWAIDLSKRTMGTIRWNLFWAYGYNALAIFVAASGALHPMIAAGLMVASSLIVITNSLRLGRTEEIVALDSADEPARNVGSASPHPSFEIVPEMPSDSPAESSQFLKVSR